MRTTQIGGDERILRRYEYEDEWIVAADLGVDDGTVGVDTVGGTAIVAVRTDGDVVETELDLPDEAATATVNNGVVTVEGNR